MNSSMDFNEFGAQVLEELKAGKLHLHISFC